MRIVAQSGTAKVTLADHGVESPSGLDWGSVRMLQEDEFVRGEAIMVRDRGNVRTDITFSVSREHASGAEAETFIAEHAAAVPRVADVTFAYLTDTGGEVQRFLLDAGIPEVRIRQIGATTMTSYRIVGGAISKKKP